MHTLVFLYQVSPRGVGELGESATLGGSGDLSRRWTWWRVEFNIRHHPDWSSPRNSRVGIIWLKTFIKWVAHKSAYTKSKPTYGMVELTRLNKPLPGEIHRTSRTFSPICISIVTAYQITKPTSSKGFASVLERSNRPLNELGYVWNYRVHNGSKTMLLKS